MLYIVKIEAESEISKADYKVSGQFNDSENHYYSALAALDGGDWWARSEIGWPSTVLSLKRR
jgi:hypothetical protein